VIEYNCRFGDPETQVVLPLLESDLYTVMRAVSDGRLKDCEVKFSDKSACCVVVASKGYPENYEKGYEITIDNKVKDFVYFAGAGIKDNKLVTDGGRVLGVTAVEDNLEYAIKSAYEKVSKISFANMYYRHDIGAKALLAVKEEK
ncbi:MAG: phosphoribosylamine--glycine ligase, partial [Clostridia bacterium]|nr:phosphoribosylamine--glycine ligase [Clostridia bacterium]